MMKMMLKPAVLAGVGLFALLSAACSAEPGSAPAATSPAVPPATSSAPAATRAANLPVTEELRTLLGDAYFQATGSTLGTSRDKVIGPEQVFHGKVTGADPSQDVFYAMGETGYSGNPVSRQDGPHVWRKRGGGAWEYLGDTGGDFCGKIPQRLVQVWGRLCP